MSIRKYYELSCDNCSCADHYPIGIDLVKAARENGWIITKNKKHYDTRECYIKARKERKS